MTTDSLILTLGILATSFFGSWHCAGMCGPVASILAQRGQLFSYHFFRLIAYVSLGAIAGHLGGFFLNSGFNHLRWISAVIFSTTLILMGIKNLWPNIFIHSSFRIINQLIAKIQVFKLNKPGWLIGLLTVFLPCGWLYTYVLAAVASKSAFAGALIMLLFFLGGLPALLAMPWMIKKTIERSTLRQKKIASGILILAGIYNIISFYYLH